jgi:hypothetical protein
LPVKQGKSTLFVFGQLWKISVQVDVLKGHSFSRADREPSWIWALQAAEKLLPAVGRGFIPGINAME